MSQKKKAYEFNKQTPAAPPAVRKVETDEILSGTDKVQYIIGMHWKKIAIGLGAAVVIVLALIVIKFVREHNDLKLRQELSGTKTIEQLQALVDEHKDHPAAIPALFRLGGLYAEKGENAKAAETFKRIYDALENVSDFDHLRGGIAAAYQLEAAGQDDKALALFVSISQDQTIPEYPLLLQEAAYNAARLNLKKNDKTAALTMLEKVQIPQEATQNFWLSQCKKLKARLEAAK